jgi:flagellin
MRELAVQMENGIYTSKDRDNAQLEINALLQEIDKIAVNTRFNDVNLLDGNYDQTIRAGNTNAETIRVAVDGLKTLDTAKIEDFAVEKAFKTTSQQAANNIVNTNNLITVNEGKSVTIDTSLFSSTFKEFFKADSLGTFTLANTVLDQSGNTLAANDAADLDNQAFTIDAKTGKITSKYIMDHQADNTTDVQWNDLSANGGGNIYNDLVAAGSKISLSAGGDDDFRIKVTYTNRAGTAHTESLVLTLADVNQRTLSGIKVETQAESTRTVETLDKALEQVSSAQAKLGAIQNRLQHNIDNLSKGAMLTEQAVGRVVDADFASETSSLSKQQILNQAATAMLAQANQSKQSVLTLLQ